MNALNIARINERVPYEVWQTSEGGVNHHCRGSEELHGHDCSERQSAIRKHYP